MKITLPHLPEVTIFVILLGQCFMVGCDEQDRRAELSAMNVQGEANLEYLDKPGLFGAKGVQLSLENFSLAEGIDKTYVLRNIPATKQPYRLLFLPDTRLGNDLSSNLQMTTTLEDSSGKLYWNVEVPLSQWRTSETGGRIEHFYMLPAGTGVSECAFVPSPNTEYRLHVKCKASNADLTETATNRNVRFCLRAGGYK